MPRSRLLALIHSDLPFLNHATTKVSLTPDIWFEPLDRAALLPPLANSAVDRVTEELALARWGITTEGADEEKGQEGAILKLWLALLAFWLAETRPNDYPLGIQLDADSGEFQSFNFLQPFVQLPGDLGVPATDEILNQARSYLVALLSQQKQSAVRAAINFLLRGLTETNPGPRLVELWIALEALFGAETEISFRISQRIALFLAKDSTEGRELFRKTKKSYSFRSRIVHGPRKKGKDTPEEAVEVLLHTESMLRRSFSKILLDPDLIEKFNSEKREEFLDELVFDVLKSPPDPPSVENT